MSLKTDINATMKTLIKERGRSYRSAKYLSVVIGWGLTFLIVATIVVASVLLFAWYGMLPALIFLVFVFMHSSHYKSFRNQSVLNNALLTQDQLLASGLSSLSEASSHNTQAIEALTKGLGVIRDAIFRDVKGKEQLH